MAQRVLTQSAGTACLLACIRQCSLTPLHGFGECRNGSLLFITGLLGGALLLLERCLLLTQQCDALLQLLPVFHILRCALCRELCVFHSCLCSLKFCSNLFGALRLGLTGLEISLCFRQLILDLLHLLLQALNFYDFIVKLPLFLQQRFVLLLRFFCCFPELVVFATRPTSRCEVRCVFVADALHERGVIVSSLLGAESGIPVKGPHNTWDARCADPCRELPLAQEERRGELLVKVFRKDPSKLVVSLAAGVLAQLRSGDVELRVLPFPPLFGNGEAVIANRRLKPYRRRNVPPDRGEHANLLPAGSMALVQHCRQRVKDGGFARLVVAMDDDHAGIWQVSEF